ncbi:unnamed protein product, partial [Darwinula stevensoni]
DRRLVLLRVLEQSSGYAANAYVLMSMLDSTGHRASHEELDADLVWLQAQGLIVLESVADVVIATITRKGVDVALGKAIVQGGFDMGRKSTVAVLPEEVVTQINRLIRDGCTIDEILRALAPLGAEVSRSAMGRYVKSARESMEKYRQAQEVAK